MVELLERAPDPLWSIVFLDLGTQVRLALNSPFSIRTAPPVWGRPSHNNTIFQKTEKFQARHSLAAKKSPRKHNILEGHSAVAVKLNLNARK